MTTRKKAATAKVNGTTPEVTDAMPSPVMRYQRIMEPQYRWVDFRDSGADADSKPLSVRIRTNLMFGEIDAIPVNTPTSYEDLYDAIAQYCVEWNIVGTNAETGEVESVPSPAEAGRDVLPCLTKREVTWLARAVALEYRQRVESDEGKKDSATPEPTASP